MKFKLTHRGKPQALLGDSPRFDLYDGLLEFLISAKMFIAKRRKKRIFGVLRRQLGEIFHELAGHKESKVVEGHLMGDHVHMCLSIPPKYAVSNVVDYIKGKSAIQIARKFGDRQKNFTGEHILARGYFVSTVGLDEHMVRAYTCGIKKRQASAMT